MKGSSALFGMALLIPHGAQADFYLKPLHTPKPEYPHRLGFVRDLGEAKVRLTVLANGTVGEVKVVKINHPGMARALERQLRLWRYEPWLAGDGAPPSVTLIIPFLFIGVNGGWVPRQYSHRVRRCDELVRERDKFLIEYPGRALIHMQTYKQVRDGLNAAFANGKISADYNQALKRQLRNAWPGVLVACEKQPKKSYVDFLPVDKPV